MGDYKDRLRIYYDAEMTGLTMRDSLISIGMVAESGAQFYAETSWFNVGNDGRVIRLNPWIEENVVPNLLFGVTDTIEDIREFTDPDGFTHINAYIKGGPKLITGYLTSWLNCEKAATGKAKVQLFTDCYAYDWAFLMDLICPDGDALNIPEDIDYIPIDLSTLMYFTGIDPDISREKFAGKLFIDALKERGIFKDMKNPKHNSLWDAWIASECFMKIMKGIQNKDLKYV